MAMSHGWSTSGGKSGSTFERSDDRRFVIKQVSRSEFQAFTRNSLAYFDHMREVMCGNIDTREAVLLDGSSSGPHIIRRRRPSFLLRIVGAYEVSVTFTPSPRDSQGVLLPRPPPKRSYQRNVFVMENLWYGTEVPDGLKFDLKGLARNMTSKQDDVQATITKAKQTESQRAHQAAQAEGDPAGTGALPETASAAGGGSPGTAAQGTIKSGTVLLDSDFQSITEGQPIAVTETSMALLMDGLRGDTDFLCQSRCMDYSLLVGVSSATGRLIVGIIDYANTFTAAKRLENAFKSIIESEVTIQEPARYRARMLRKARSYFMPVPSRLAGPNIALQARDPTPIDSVGTFWEASDAPLDGDGDEYGWRRASDPLRRLLRATDPNQRQDSNQAEVPAAAMPSTVT